MATFVAVAGPLSGAFTGALLSFGGMLRGEMDFAQEQREALRLLEGIENGTLDVSTSAQLIDDADPALVYLIFTWLRKRYGGDHPAAEGVIGRLVELTNRPGSVKAKMAEGKTDPVVAWFEEGHAYRDFDAKAFIALVVDKLES